MVGSAFAMCGLILVYHCYVVCQRIEAIKRLNIESYFVSKWASESSH